MRKFLISGLFLMGFGPALAQPGDDFAGTYVALRGSYAFSGNATTTYAPTTPATELRGSYASGGGGSIAFGTHLPLNLRLEIEGLYRYQSLSKVSLNGVDTVAGGHTQIASPMMNILWDIPMPVESDLQPFVGIGGRRGLCRDRGFGLRQCLYAAGPLGPRLQLHRRHGHAAGRQLAPHRHVPLDAGARRRPQMRRLRHGRKQLPEQQCQQFCRGPGLRNGPVSFASLR